MTDRASDLVRLFLTSTLIASLMASLLCGVARGDDLSAGKSFRIPTAAFAPIGKVYSLGEVWINGRLAPGEPTIWHGDLIEVRGKGGSSLVLAAIGQIALRPRTVIRLFTVTATANERIGGQVLIISLITGEVSAKLQDGKVVRVEAAGSQFISSAGARFRIDLCDGRPVVEVSRGSVSINASPLQREWIVIQVDADPLTGRPRGGRIAALKKAVKDHKRVYYFQVRERNIGTRNEGTPVGPGIRVTASLTTPGVGEVGSQSVDVFTNDYGVVQVTFTAGHNPGSTEIVVAADLPHTGTPFIGTIEVAKPPWFSKPQNIALISAGAAAVAIVKVIVDRSKPLRQEPPPVIP